MSIFMRLIIGIGMLLIKQNIEGCIFELLSSPAERRQPCLDYCRYRRIKDDKNRQVNKQPQADDAVRQRDSGG